MPTKRKDKAEEQESWKRYEDLVWRQSNGKQKSMNKTKRAIRAIKNWKIEIVPECTRTFWAINFKWTIVIHCCIHVSAIVFAIWGPLCSGITRETKVAPMKSRGIVIDAEHNQINTRTHTKVLVRKASADAVRTQRSTSFTHSSNSAELRKTIVTQFSHKTLTTQRGLYCFTSISDWWILLRTPMVKKKCQKGKYPITISPARAQIPLGTSAKNMHKLAKYQKRGVRGQRPGRICCAGSDFFRIFVCLLFINGKQLLIM